MEKLIKFVFLALTLTLIAIPFLSKIYPVLAVVIWIIYCFLFLFFLILVRHKILRKFVKELYFSLRDIINSFISLLYPITIIQYLYTTFIFIFIFQKEISIFTFFLYIAVIYLLTESLYKLPETRIDYFISYFKSTFILFLSFYIYSLLYKASFLETITKYLSFFFGEKITNIFISFFRTQLIELKSEIIAILSLIITAILEIYKKAKTNSKNFL